MYSVRQRFPFSRTVGPDAQSRLPAEYSGRPKRGILQRNDVETYLFIAYLHYFAETRNKPPGHMEIKSLGGTGFDAIYEAFDRAFADYEVQNDKEQFRAMLQRRGFDPALSFAAFENGAIVAFTLNGTGNFNGMPTAYDTGTGTLKEYGGQGLATRIFEHSIPHLQRQGIGQYLLEVLQHNTKAISVYRNLGFETTREFNYFIGDNRKVATDTKTSGGFRIERIEPEDLVDVSAFRDFHPSWQNSFEAIGRSPGVLFAWGIRGE